MGRVEGKVAIVTGAARGLGEATARLLAAEGATVLLTDILEDQGEKTAASIRKDGGAAAFLKQDTTDVGQWQGVVEHTKSAYGRLDILINNAGIEIIKPISETTLEDLQRISAINEHGVFMGMKYSAPVMAETGGGSIVNLSSVAGLGGYPHLAAYCMTKGGVRLVTKAAAMEFAGLGYNVRVNSIHPGVIQTQMGQNVIDKSTDMGFTTNPNENYDFWVKAYPLGRIGQPPDVANAALFLSSDESAWMTGTEIHVDGGAMAS